jgi:hypothetical protein
VVDLGNEDETMQSIRDERVRTDVIDRINRLTPESVRRWGAMQHAQLLVHLADGFRLALGRSDVTPRGFTRFAPIRHLLIHRLPWPRGKAEAPPGSFQRPVLLDLIDQYMAASPETLGKMHPMFGRMKARDWDVLMYRHLDHHLTQFSV